MAELNNDIEDIELLNYISVRRLREFYLGLKDKLNKIEDMPDLGKLLITINEDGEEKQFLVDRDEYIKPGKPVFNPSSGTFTKSKTLTISTTTSDATIRYTISTTGAPPVDPTINTGIVGNSVTLEQDVSTPTIEYKLKAIAVKNGLVSPVSDIATIYINRQVATPTISASGVEYDDSRTVTISCATNGATIHYTIDGSTPTESSPIYNSSNKPVLNSTATVKAMAIVDDSWVNSEVGSKSITVGTKYTHAGLSDLSDVDSSTAATLLPTLTVTEQGGVKKPSPAGKYTFTTTTSAKYIWFAVPRNYSITEVANGAVPQQFTMKYDDTTGGYKYYRMDGQMIANQSITLTVTA